MAILALRNRMQQPLEKVIRSLEPTLDALTDKDDRA